jgi:hypothetical protein
LIPKASNRGNHSIPFRQTSPESMLALPTLSRTDLTVPLSTILIYNSNESWPPCTAVVGLARASSGDQIVAAPPPFGSPWSPDSNALIQASGEGLSLHLYRPPMFTCRDDIIRQLNYLTWSLSTW